MNLDAVPGRVIVIAGCVLLAAAGGVFGYDRLVREPEPATPEDIVAGKFTAGDWIRLTGTYFSNNISNLEYKYTVSKEGTSTVTQEISTFQYVPILCAGDPIIGRAAALHEMIVKLDAFPVDDITDADSGPGKEAFDMAGAFTTAWNEIGTPACFVLMENLASKKQESYGKSTTTPPITVDPKWLTDATKDLRDRMRENNALGQDIPNFNNLPDIPKLPPDLLGQISRLGMTGFTLDPDTYFTSYESTLKSAEDQPVEVAIKTPLDQPPTPEHLEFMSLSQIRVIATKYRELVERYNAEIDRRNQHVFSENRKEFRSFLEAARKIDDGLSASFRYKYAVTGVLKTPHDKVIAKYRDEITKGIAPVVVLTAGGKPSVKLPVGLGLSGIVLLFLWFRFVRRRY